MGDWQLDQAQIQILIAATLGTLIGLEREFSGKDPSVRTFALISMGSCIFTILSFDAVSGSKLGDPARIAAQIIPGIGFIGAGTIFRSKKGGVSGFTTAALMWIAASIGMAVGLNQTKIAVFATGIAIFITVSLRIFHRIIARLRPEATPNVAEDD